MMIYASNQMPAQGGHDRLAELKTQITNNHKHVMPTLCGHVEKKMSYKIQKAKELATEKHSHLHLYNAAKSPAIDHIAEVATLVEEHGGNENMICAAWLHDIVEDTDVALDDVKDIFGEDIARIVDGLTDPKDFSYLPLLMRKEKQARRLKSKSNDIKSIKICDQLSNIMRVTNDAPTDWDDDKKWVYVLGAKKVVDVCVGISTELDKKFNDAFERAKIKYGVKQ